MALLVSVQQAACNALKPFLAAQLSDIDGGIVIFDRWPEPTIELPPKAIAILLAGAPVDDLLDPVVLSSTPHLNSSTPDLVLVDVIYGYRVRRQQLQLNVWAAYDTHRDDIVARLDRALNASDQLTVGNWNSEPVRNGLTLQLSADGWSGYAEFLFDGPELDSAADKTQQAEFTATYRGHVDVMLTRTVTVSKIVEIKLKQHASETPVPHEESLPTDVTTITASGATFTVEPPT